MKSHYLNTDLCLVSRRDLFPLIESLRAQTEVLHCGKLGRKWFATFEAKDSGRLDKRKPQDDIVRLLKVFGSLRGGAREHWTGCLSREMNVGWQAAENRPEGSFQLESEVLLQLAKHGVQLAVTIYPARENES